MSAGWFLQALNARSNHVHVVVSAPQVEPERIMNALKAYATRRLRQHGHVGTTERVWSRHGSTRYLWDEHAVSEACWYVTDRQ